MNSSCRYNFLFSHFVSLLYSTLPWLILQVNLNATDPILGRTPLHFAAQYNRAVLAKLLVNKGATVDAVDNNGETATQIAERLKWKKVR